MSSLRQINFEQNNRGRKLSRDNVQKLCKIHSAEKQGTICNDKEILGKIFREYEDQIL